MSWIKLIVVVSGLMDVPNDVFGAVDIYTAPAGALFRTMSPHRTNGPSHATCPWIYEVRVGRPFGRSITMGLEVRGTSWHGLGYTGLPSQPTTVRRA